MGSVLHELLPLIPWSLLISLPFVVLMIFVDYKARSAPPSDQEK